MVIEQQDYEFAELKKELDLTKKHQAELYKEIADYDEQEQVMIKLLKQKNNDIAELQKNLLQAKEEIADYEEAEQRIMTLINEKGNSGQIYHLVLPVHYREDGWKTGKYNLDE